MKIVDPGHIYNLHVLDGEEHPLVRLWFVKRVGDKYPGNKHPHPGTNLQEVFRACIDRMKYLQAQVPCEENEIVIKNLRNIIYQLEVRAAYRHNRSLHRYKGEIEEQPICEYCGHIQCGGTCRERTL